MNNINWDMVGSIGTIFAVITSFVVLFLQRCFDDKKSLQENEGRIDIGTFYSEFTETNVGYYFDTESSIRENPFIRSEITIPVVNVGKTPVSTVEVKVTFPTIYKTIDTWKKDGINSKLNISKFTQIYAEYSEQDKIKYQIIYNERKKEIINSRTFRTYRIGSLISGEHYSLKLSSREELYLQYLLFMLNQRSIRKNTPNDIGVSLGESTSTSEYFQGFKLEIKYKDYLGIQQKKDFYLGLFTEGFKEFYDNNHSIKRKIQSWHLAPVYYDQIKDYL